MYILKSSCDPCLKQEQLSRWLIQTIWKYLKFFWQSERGQEEVGEANWKIGEGGQPEQVTGWVKQFKRENCKNNGLCLIVFYVFPVFIDWLFILYICAVYGQFALFLH